MSGLKKTLLRLMGLPPPSRGSPLDCEFGRWTEKDRFTLRDMLRSVAIFGGTGSGKTSGSGKWLGEAIVNNRQTCGLILCAKPEDKAMWQQIFADAGRSEDLLIFEPDAALRLNFLDFLVQAGADAREVTKCISSIAETLRSGGNGGREDGQFWQGEQERMTYNAVVPVKLATGRVTAPELQQFITTAANCPAELRDPDWQAKFHSRCMQAAYARAKSARDEHDFELAKDYWFAEFPGMADRTRSSILVGVLGTYHVFNTGIVRQLVSETTNVSPDDMLKCGRWVLVNMPPAQHGDGGKFINTGWKFLTEWSVLRRHAQESDFVNVIWCDEAQQFLTAFDSEYLAQSRSHLGCVCFLSQSLHSYYAAVPGEGGRHQVDALLGNLSLRIIHALGDVQTAHFASETLGKELRTFIGGSLAPQEDLFDTLMGRSRFTGNFDQRYEYVLQPDVFMNGLRTGGPANGFVVDAILVKSGEPFSNGRNYLQVSFSQR